MYDISTTESLVRYAFKKTKQDFLGIFPNVRDQSRILADEQHGIFALGVWGIQGMQVCIEY